MELFNETGHLTTEGLAALVEENPTLTELERLELAEHLSFCDECLIRYTALLDDSTTLQAPPRPLRDGVMKRIRRRAIAFPLKQIATVGAAACMMVVLFGAGLFFNAGIGEPAAVPSAPTTSQGPGLGLGQRLSDATRGIANGIGSFFDGIFPAAPAEEEDDNTQNERTAPADSTSEAG